MSADGICAALITYGGLLCGREGAVADLWFCGGTPFPVVAAAAMQAYIGAVGRAVLDTGCKAWWIGMSRAMHRVFGVSASLCVISPAV